MKFSLLKQAIMEIGTISFAGNRKLMIYGKLNCKSGKRMNDENRVFFSSEEAAWSAGFRPCGHCMRREYLIWKHNPGNN